MSDPDLPATADLLVHDHGDLDETLSALDRAFEAGDLARSFDCLDQFWGRLAVHIRAENIVLFPTLLRAAEREQGVMGVQELRLLVEELRHDHDFFMFELTAAIKELRTLLRESRTEGLAEVRDRLIPVRRRIDAHNALEESRAYRYAALLLEPHEQAELHQNIQQELGNLPPRLRKDRGDG